jgi:hypothetical protein
LEGYVLLAAIIKIDGCKGLGYESSLPKGIEDPSEENM